PLPGTKDYHEMMKDLVNLETPGYVRKHRAGIVRQKFWLDPGHRAKAVTYGNMSQEDLLRENAACWNAYYSPTEILRRIRFGVGKSWPLAGKVAYFVISLVFKRVYAEHGVAADSVQRHKTGLATKLLIRTGVTVYNTFFQRKRFGFRVHV